MSCERNAPTTDSGARSAARVRDVMATSHISRALGLAQSIEGWVGPLGENGVRAVASEIVVLLTAARDEIIGSEGDDGQA